MLFDFRSHNLVIISVAMALFSCLSVSEDENECTTTIMLKLIELNILTGRKVETTKIETLLRYYLIAPMLLWCQQRQGKVPFFKPLA